MDSKSYSAGQEANALSVGDFILTHHGKWAGAIIRWGQGIRFRGENRKYAFWNHAALIISPDGELAEALTKTGVTRSHISKYKDVEYTLVRTHGSPEDQQHLLRFAQQMIGEKYGWLNDLSSFFSFLIGNSLSFGFQNQVNCSGFVARAQERLGAVFPRLPENICPADLARYYEVSS